MSNRNSQSNVLDLVDSTVLAIYQLEQHEHAKRVIRSYTLKKDRQYNCQKKKNKTKRQTMIYKTLNRKQKIEKHETH